MKNMKNVRKWLFLGSMLMIAIPVVFMVNAIGKDNKRDELLNSITFEKVVQMDEGFYKGCGGVVQERISYYKFRVLVFCGFGTEAVIDVRDFMPEIREL